MKRKNIYAYVAAGLVAATGLSACQETDYMTFDNNYNGIYFTTDSIHYSFGILPLDRTEYTRDIPVKLMGAPADHDRNFSIEILAAKDNAMPMEGVQYRIEAKNVLIKADSISGNIPVTLLRNGLEGDDENGYTRYELRIRLVSDKNFTPTLSEKDQNVVLTFDNAVEKPDWVRDDLWRTRCGEWHPIKLIKLLEFFHTNMAEQVPSIYEKMVEDVGENWERTQYGWPTDYNYSIRKYILAPEYEYFKQHPEHGITDFPDPFAVNN